MSKKKKSHSKSSGGSGNRSGGKPQNKKIPVKAAAPVHEPDEDLTEEYTEEIEAEYYPSGEDAGYDGDEYGETSDSGDYYYPEEEEEYYGEDGVGAEEEYSGGDYADEDYSGGDYAGEGYDEEYYTQEEYSDEEYSEDEYADEELPEGSGDFPLDDSPERSLFGGDSIIPEFLQPFAEKCRAQLDRLDRLLYRRYILPDENKLVTQKTTITAFAVAAAAAVLLGFGLIIFLGTYPFHTTGIKTKEFIREFNAICSDTDIKAILPDYANVVIPEKAKLGREPIYLAGGHVKLTAKTRFGRIREISVEGVDIPNYDSRNYSFKTEAREDYDPSNDQFYYYIALGKAALAAEKILGSGPFISAMDDGGYTSDADLSSEDAQPELTVYDAATCGYQLYYYAFYYYSNRINDGYVYMPMGNCYMNFTLSDMTLVIRPTVEKITALPDGLQRFWDGLTGASRKEDNGGEAALTGAAVSESSL